MTEPTTAAGRALHKKLRRGVVFVVARRADGSEFPDYALSAILAIEVEATEAAMLAAFDDVQAIDRAEARQQDASTLRLFVDLEIALGWALHYIEYQDMVPSLDIDPREGTNDLQMWTTANETVKRVALAALPEPKL